MPPSLIGKVSQRLRSLIRSSGTATVTYEVEVATLGLIERVRNAWQLRDSVAIDERFSLVDLLQTLARDRDLPSTGNDAATRKRVEASTGQGANNASMRTLDSEFLARRRYQLQDFAGSSDEMFLELAYRCVLKRHPDSTGSQPLLAGMKTGTLDRIDVLHALNASFEGRSNGVVIVGLLSRWLLRRAERVPFAGAALSWLRAILSVRTTARQLRALDERVEVRHEQQAALDATRGQSDAAVAAIADRFRRLQAESKIQLAAVTTQARESAERLRRVEELLGEERARIDALYTAIEDARSVDPRAPFT